MKTTEYKATFYAYIGIILVIIYLACTSCASMRSTQKAFIAVEVSQQLTGTYYQFHNLTHTQGRQYFLPGLPHCRPRDTIVIKTCERKTYFIK